MKHIPVIAAVAMLFAAPSYAQFTYVTPNGGGGYTAMTPGAPNPFTYYTPNGNGGYTAMTPGARNPFTYMTPNGGGGYTINTPGAGSNYPTYRGFGYGQ
jgi:hypothetical protein